VLAEAFKEPTQVIIQLPAFDLFQLIGLIQFASRGLPPEHALHSFARHAGDQLTEALTLVAGEPRLRKYIQMGWNPAYDVVQKDKPGARETDEGPAE
jgi:hypothetical protein